MKVDEKLYEKFKKEKEPIFTLSVGAWDLIVTVAALVALIVMLAVR